MANAAGAMSDEEFVRICARYPDDRVEMAADGQILITPPRYSLDGVRAAEFGARLGLWAEVDGRGIVCDASAGFVLPNGARRSPAFSWTARRRVAALEVRSRETFWRLCPDFVIELKSSSDPLRMLQSKMVEYVGNGAQLGWLIDPESRTVWVYRPGLPVETLTEAETVAGEGPVAGFVLELGRVWDPLGL